MDVIRLFCIINKKSIDIQATAYARTHTQTQLVERVKGHKKGLYCGWSVKNVFESVVELLLCQDLMSLHVCENVSVCVCE